MAAGCSNVRLGGGVNRSQRMGLMFGMIGDGHCVETVEMGRWRGTARTGGRQRLDSVEERCFL